MEILNEARWIEVKYTILAKRIFSIESHFPKAIEVIRYLIQKGGCDESIKADNMIMHTTPFLDLPPLKVTKTLAKQANVKSLRPIEKIYGISNAYSDIHLLDMDAVFPPIYTPEDREMMEAAIKGYELFGGTII